MLFKDEDVKSTILIKTNVEMNAECSFSSYFFRGRNRYKKFMKISVFMLPPSGRYKCHLTPFSCAEYIMRIAVYGQPITLSFVRVISFFMNALVFFSSFLIALLAVRSTCLIYIII